MFLFNNWLVITLNLSLHFNSQLFYKLCIVRKRGGIRLQNIELNPYKIPGYQRGEDRLDMLKHCPG